VLISGGGSSIRTANEVFDLFGLNSTEEISFRGVDTFAGLGDGTIHFSNQGFDRYSLFVKAIGGIGPTWDVRLQGSPDGLLFTDLIAHTQADGSGVLKFPPDAIPRPTYAVKSKVVGLTGGGSVQVIWIGMRG